MTGERFRYQLLEPVAGFDRGAIVDSVDVPHDARACQVAQFRHTVWVALACDCGRCDSLDRRQRVLNAVNGVRRRYR